MAIKFIDEKEPTISQGVKSLVKGGEVLTPMASFENPKAVARTGLKVAQFAGQTAFPLASGLTTTPATEYLEQKLTGATNTEALKRAGIAGGLDLALTGIGNIGFNLGKKVFKKVVPTLTGIPKESVEAAVNKPKILKGNVELDKTFEELGQKAQDAAKYIKNKAGKAVDIEKKIVKNIDEPLDLNDLADNVENRIIGTWSKSGLIEKLSSKQTEILEDISKKFRKMSNKTTSADDLLNLREKLDDTINWNRKESNNIFADVLEGIRDDIKNRLAKISPALNKANKKYQNIIELNKQIQSKIKTENVATNLKNTFKKGLQSDEPVAFLNEFKKLDELAPKNLKFVEKANNALVNKEFNRYLPNKGLLSQIRLAGALGLGGVGAYNRNEKMVGGALLLGGIGSPKVYKSLILGGSALQRAISKPIVQGTTKQLANQMLKLYREE